MCESPHRHRLFARPFVDRSNRFNPAPNSLSNINSGVNTRNAARTCRIEVS